MATPLLAQLYAARQRHPQPRLAFTDQPALRGDVLVVVFLRGAADALNMVVPHGEDAYYALRPTLSIARPDDSGTAAAQRSLDLDGFFGLHPALAPLLPAWQEQALAIVHACGAPDESRSHFTAMALMERGVSDERGPASGWIGRHLAAMDAHYGPPASASPLRAIGLGARPPRSLSGGVPVSALRSIADFHFQGQSQVTAAMQQALDGLYAESTPTGAIGRDTLRLMQALEKLDVEHYQPSGGLAYPADEFGLGLKQVAMLIKAQVGLEVAALDLGGWDTHFAQGAAGGLMARQMEILANGLAAFYADLHAQRVNLTLVVMSEFGRRAQENGSLGTDHGHGGLMLLLGGHVAGGQVHGRWPGLAAEQLVGPGDLAVTTDYRDVLAAICSRRLHNPAAEGLFPGYQPLPIEVIQLNAV